MPTSIASRPRPNPSNGWRWAEGPVDQTGEHLELFDGPFGPSAKLVARMGRIGDRAVAVDFVSDDVEAIEAAKREIQTYISGLGGPRAWEYLIYHCGTLSNAYSKIHWGYVPQA